MKPFAVIAAILACTARADEVSVAVSSNFQAPMQAIAAQFERDTGHTLRFSVGATGKFYTQIVQGAPFEVLLSADVETPERLIQAGHAVPGTATPYAIGKLVLWSAQAGFVDPRGDILQKTGAFAHLAIANPDTAPYGRAARQVLQRLGRWEALKPFLVQGENIAQTHQFVASGAAELGFVAHAQGITNGWVVPSDLYDPIRQNVVLLTRGQDRPAAKALLSALTQPAMRAIIQRFGYDVP